MQITITYNIESKYIIFSLFLQLYQNKHKLLKLIILCSFYSIINLLITLLYLKVIIIYYNSIFLILSYIILNLVTTNIIKYIDHLLS